LEGDDVSSRRRMQTESTRRAFWCLRAAGDPEAKKARKSRGLIA
jgi:hypothetical protein